MEVSFLKSINKASKTFDKKISNAKNIAIVFDENVDGFSSAKIFSILLERKNKEFEIYIKRREEKIDEKLLKYDFVIFLDISFKKDELKIIKNLKNAIIIDDQKPLTLTLKKFLVLNPYLYKTFTSSSSICYFLSQHIYSTKEIIFYSMLGTKYDNFSIKSLEKKFLNFFSKEDLKFVNAIQYFIRTSKDKKVLKFLEIEGENNLKKRLKSILKKVEKIVKKKKVKCGLTRIVASYLYEKEKKPIAIFSNDKKEITILSKKISILPNSNWKFFEFFNEGVEILANKKEIEKIIEDVNK
jgi:single-stranded DNA-specific DHH superfamily exonuclease